MGNTVEGFDVMETCGTTEAFGDALARAYSKMDKVLKDKVNPAFKSRYADEAAILEVVRPALLEEGIVLQCIPVNGDDGQVGHKVVLRFKSEHIIEGPFFMRPAKVDPQGITGCLTYNRKGIFAGLFNVPQEDDDGNTAAGNGKAAQKSSPPPPTRQQLIHISTAQQTLGMPFDFPDTGEEAARWIADYAPKVKAKRAEAPKPTPAREQEPKPSA